MEEAKPSKTHHLNTTQLLKEETTINQYTVELVKVEDLVKVRDGALSENFIEDYTPRKENKSYCPSEGLLERSSSKAWSHTFRESWNFQEKVLRSTSLTDILNEETELPMRRRNTLTQSPRNMNTELRKISDHSPRPPNKSNYSSPPPRGYGSPPLVLSMRTMSPSANRSPSPSPDFLYSSLKKSVPSPTAALPRSPRLALYNSFSDLSSLRTKSVETEAKRAQFRMEQTLARIRGETQTKVFSPILSNTPKPPNNRTIEKPKISTTMENQDMIQSPRLELTPRQTPPLPPPYATLSSNIRPTTHVIIESPPIVDIIELQEDEDTRNRTEPPHSTEATDDPNITSTKFMDFMQRWRLTTTYEPNASTQPINTDLPASYHQFNNYKYEVYKPIEMFVDVIPNTTTSSVSHVSKQSPPVLNAPRQTSVKFPRPRSSSNSKIPFEIQTTQRTSIGDELLVKSSLPSSFRTPNLKPSIIKRRDTKTGVFPGGE